MAVMSARTEIPQVATKLVRHRKDDATQPLRCADGVPHDVAIAEVGGNPDVNCKILDRGLVH